MIGNGENMGIVFDGIIIIILLVNIISGYKSGLVHVVFNIFAFLVALIVTLVLYRPIANQVIRTSNFDEKIESIIIENCTSENDEQSESKNSAALQKYVEKYAKDIVTDAKDNAVEVAARAIAENVVSIAVLIILFIIVRLALIIVRFLADGIAELPIIKQFNEIGGFAYVVLRGFIIIEALLAVLFFIVSISGNNSISNAIDSSFITKILYGNNIILKILF